MAKQIVYDGYTSADVWDELEERSIQTLISFAPQCPVCSAQIQHTGRRELRCLGCEAPVAVFQERHLRPNADERVIFVEVKGQSRDVLKLNAQCLSCEESIHKDEFCRRSCRMQTYLVLEVISKQLYVKRWVNPPDAAREGTEILIHQHFEIEAEAPESVCIQGGEAASHHAAAHKDVAGQIVKYLSENGDIGKTEKMRTAIGCSPQGFNKAIKKLIGNGRVKKIARGFYELITPKET